MLTPYLQLHQPFIRLVQSNAKLFLEFATSREVTSEATENVAVALQQATKSATKLFFGQAFMILMQGCMRNYSQFLLDSGGIRSSLDDARSWLPGHEPELTESAEPSLLATSLQGR
jgi:hypothetical protein